ncbi:MAG: NAD(P)-binding domain-containing protein, partial [Clostridia bacterium]|nr:NAD(P)-binding domain-containing protein [Clostridia bacterium]
MALKVSVIGAGSWGTALAKVLADNGHEVKMWSATQQHLIDMEAARENVRYLPGVKLPDSIKICLDERECLKDAEMVLFSVPAQKFRTAFQIALAMMPEDAIVVNVAKGIETASLMRLSEIAYSIKPGLKYAILSGPSHAEEVGRGMPTTVTAASKDPELAEFVQDAFMNKYFRIYTNDDIPGVELGGALKNIIALGAGIADGLGYG